MGTLKFSVPHDLEQSDARARMEALLKHWSQKHGIQCSWTGEVAKVDGKVMGIQLQATLRVGPGAVEGDASDPGLLLRGQARKYLEEKLRGYLDPDKTLGDLQRSPV